MALSLPSVEAWGAGRAPWVLVSAGFHYRGGQSRANAALADYLLARRTPVHLVAHEVDRRLLDHPGVTVHRVPRPAGADFLGNLFLRRRGRAVARRICGAQPGARVLVNGGNCRWPDINWVHYVHNAWRPPSQGAPLWFKVKNALAGAAARRQERRALTCARVVIANSEQTRTELIARFGLEATRVHNVYLGGDPAWRPATAAERAAARDWLGQPGHRPLAVFVGGLGHDERKGFDTLWSSWRSLCQDAAWDVDLVVAGDGARTAFWQTGVRASGLGERVRLIGFTERVFDLLAAADVLVSPVRYEPYGLNVQEAVCRGVPALVSARAGVVERYPRELADMILPDPGDWRDLAARLVRWRADVSGWRRRFEPLARELRSYSWNEMARRIVAVAEQAPVAAGPRPKVNPTAAYRA
jgi:glycosyltransferase involved in cell wall biosynthesis